MFFGIRRPTLVLVTGAGSGIGQAAAVRFARDGATVIATDADLAAAEQTVAQIVGAQGKAVAFRLDVTDRSAWAGLATAVIERHGTPDVLVNAAATAVSGGFVDQPKPSWDRQLAINFEGVVNGCRIFARCMVDEGRGQIVNVASVHAYTPLPMSTAYNTAAAGIRMFSECLRTEMAGYGVGVSVVCPARSATGDDVAAQIVRVTNFDWGVAPVRREAWAAYAASRIAPRLYRYAIARVGHDLLPDHRGESGEAATRIGVEGRSRRS